MFIKGFFGVRVWAGDLGFDRWFLPREVGMIGMPSQSPRYCGTSTYAQTPIYVRMPLYSAVLGLMGEGMQEVSPLLLALSPSRARAL